MKYTNTTDNVETIPKPNLKIVETEANSKPLAHICMTAFWLGADTSKKPGGVRLA